MSDEKTRQQVSQFSKETEAIRFKSIKTKSLKSQNEIERLSNQKFYNPYDVLLLDGSATDDEIKKQYRNFSLLLHPDRCRDVRAKDSWQIVQQAYKTLNDPDKRKVYLRIMREAKQRTEFEIMKQNKKRQKIGQLQLPQSAFQEMYQGRCQSIFRELEDKKDHIIKLQQSNFQRRVDDLQTRKIVEQFKVLTEEEWERSRDKRVSNWRDFSKKKQKYVVGSKKSSGSIRPPPTKAELRPHYTQIDDKKKNL